MITSLVINPQKLQTQGDGNIRSCIIDCYKNNHKSCSTRLYYSFPKTIEPPDDNDCDSYLIAIVFDAMAEGRRIIVKGSVSRLLLLNLKEYIGCWHKWFPETYKIVDIQAEKVRMDERLNLEPICTFSGGVDGTFTVWKNFKQKHNTEKLNI